MRRAPRSTELRTALIELSSVSFCREVYRGTSETSMESQVKGRLPDAEECTTRLRNDRRSAVVASRYRNLNGAYTPKFHSPTESATIPGAL